MSESKVQIAPDNTGTGNHAVRTETVVPVSTGTSVEQQVVTLADDSGNIVGVAEGRALMTTDDMTQFLLRAMILRLDLLIGAVDKNYTPPDDLGFE